jgi:hypothetical protein
MGSVPSALAGGVPALASRVLDARASSSHRGVGREPHRGGSFSHLLP